MSPMSGAGNAPDTRLKRREVYRHWASEHVRFSDTDLVGHANNLVFGAFAETGRCLFMRRFTDDRFGQRTMILPVQVTLNFHAELYWPAQVEIGTGVLALGNTSLRLGQGMFEAERCFGSAESVLVAIDEQTRRPKPLPPDVREWFAQYLIA